MITAFDVGVKMSCTNTPWLCCVPPETRWTDSVAACVTPSNRRLDTAATYASSWLSPSTHRQSMPALKALVVPNAFDPLHHAADAVGRHVLIGREPDTFAA